MSNIFHSVGNEKKKYHLFFKIQGYCVTKYPFSHFKNYSSPSFKKYCSACSGKYGFAHFVKYSFACFTNHSFSHFKSYSFPHFANLHSFLIMQNTVKLISQNAVLLVCKIQFSVTQQSLAVFANYNCFFFCLKRQFCSFCKVQFSRFRKYSSLLVSQKTVLLVS